MDTPTAEHSVLSNTEQRALSLLGGGYSPEVVASSLGVTTSRISQLLADENFAKQVIDLKFQNLQKHNIADASYDEMEDKLQKRFSESLPMLHRPMEILKAMKEINAMKRRGVSSPEAITHQNQVVNLYMPVKITNKYITNINNQVVKVGEKELLTVQSSAMEQLAARRKKSNDVENAKSITYSDPASTGT